MLSLRYSFRLITAFFKKFKGLITLGFFIGIIFFLLARFLMPLLFEGKKEIIGYVGKYHTDSLPSDILNLIGDGLTRVDDAGNIEPNLALSWESSDRGKTWVFHLDEKKRWHDDENLTSDDINYNFSDAEIERPDQKTIIFKLKSDYTPFPSVVSKPVFKKGLLGTGNWKIKKLSVSAGYVQQINLVDSKRNQKIIKFYPTEENAKLAMKLGKVNILDNVFDPKPFDDWRTFKVTGNQNNQKIVTLFFNTKDPKLGEKSLRQALSYAINKDSLSDKRALSPISEASWAHNPQVKPYNFDVNRAKSLISDLDDPVKNDLKIDIVTNYMLLPIAEQISGQWRNVGVESQVLVSSIIPTEYQTFLVIFEIPNDPDQYSVWHSTQSSTNYSKYQNPRIDKLLEDGRSELNLDERRKIYLDFQRFLLEDAPAVFLYYPTTYRIERVR